VLIPSQEWLQLDSLHKQGVVEHQMVDIPEWGMSLGVDSNLQKVSNQLTLHNTIAICSLSPLPPNIHDTSLSLYYIDI